MTLLQDLRNNMAGIGEVAPRIPSTVVNNFKKRTQNSHVDKPLITKGLTPITICVEDEQHAQVSPVKQTQESQTTQSRTELVEPLPTTAVSLSWPTVREINKALVSHKK